MFQAEESCRSHEVDLEKVRSFQSPVPDMGYVVTLFKVIGDETRAKILYLLTQESFCVHDLAAALGTSVSNISHHLRLLKAMRLVRTRRYGQRVCYSLDDEHVAHLLDEALKHASHS